MTLRDIFHWHNLALVALLAAIAGDIVFGFDAVLNLISTAAIVVSMLVIAAVFSLAAIILFWFTVRDLVEDIRSDKRSAIAWRWKILALAGGLGILADGVVGAWNAYQKHMLFSTAVQHIPFSGIPVFLLLASYPFKWIEQYFERRNQKPAQRDDLD
jgi:hypothetical protein